MRLIPSRTILIALLAFSCQGVFSPLAQAHGNHGGANPVLEDESVEALHEHITEAIEEAIRHGVGTVSSNDELRVGAKLLDAVYDELITDLKQEHPSFSKIASERLKMILRSFNPVVLGRWALQVARRQGPGIAAAYILSEAVEQACVLLAIKFPMLMFVVPLSATHVTDVIVFSAVFALPRAVRLIRLWNRYGGVFSGPGAYFQSLRAKRLLLPIDWSVAIDVSSLKLALGADGAQDIQFAILRESFLERRLPAGLRIVFGPRKLAQREAVPTFSIAELEQLAKKAGVHLRSLRAFKSEPALYGTILLREISANEASATAFASELRIRHEKSAIGGVARPDNAWSHARLVDAEEVLQAESPEALQRLGHEAGETPDLLAERALWHLRVTLDELDERMAALWRAKDVGPAVQRGVIQKNIRRLRKFVGHGQKLEVLATTPLGSSGFADWQKLYDLIQQTEALKKTIDEALPRQPADACEKLLMTA